jgi:hypothetical protein
VEPGSLPVDRDVAALDGLYTAGYAEGAGTMACTTKSNGGTAYVVRVSHSRGATSNGSGTR